MRLSLRLRSVMFALPGTSTQVAEALWPGKARRKRGFVSMDLSKLARLGYVERRDDADGGGWQLTSLGRTALDD